MQGAVVRADTVKADVGGNLSITSLQDASDYASKQQSMGGSVTIGTGSGGSFNAGNSKVDSTYASVAETSGIKAGDGGFQVNVGQDTSLTGAVISSSQRAVEAGRNSFATGGALTTTDIQNSASYSASSTSVGVGTGAQASVLGIAGTGVGLGHDSGSASSTTTSGVSGIAGDKSVRSTDAETGIARIFEQERVQREIDAQARITETFGREASKAIGDYAEGRMREANALRAQASAETDVDQQVRLNAEADSIIAQWGDNGTLRLAAHTAIGGLTGGASGAAGSAVGTLSAPAIADALRDAGIEGPLASAITGIGSTLIGAAAGGTAGGAAALNEVANNYLKHGEARRLGELRDKKLVGQCDSTCEGEIKSLEALDKQRNLDLQACQGQTTAACQTTFTEVRQAAADYIRSNAPPPGTTFTYQNERSETISLALNTMGDYSVWTVGAGVVTSIADGVKATGQALYTGFKAALGDPTAQAQAKEGLGAAWDFVSDPDNWPQLLGAMSPAQREELAKAYEAGDGTKIASVIGAQLTNLPVGGGAGTVKTIVKAADKVEDIALLAKRLDVERVVEVPAGAKANWDPKINTGTTGALSPKTAYVLDNGHTYVTDAAGRVNKVEGELRLTTKDRNTYQQACAGQAGCVGDDGGHLIASSLGGAGDRVNLVPQASTLNREDWKAMENYFRSELKAGKSVSVKIEVGYPEGSTPRPSSFNVVANVNGVIKEFPFRQ